MQHDFKRQTEVTKTTNQSIQQRSVGSIGIQAQNVMRVQQQAIRQTKYEAFIQRFTDTPEAQIAVDVLKPTTFQATPEKIEQARALPPTNRIRLQRLLQSPYVVKSVSLGREPLSPAKAASDQTVQDLTGIPLQRVISPQPDLTTRLQRHRATKIETQATENLEPDTAKNFTIPNFASSIQRSTSHSSATTDHLQTIQAAQIQRQRIVNTRAQEISQQLSAPHIQRLRAPQASTVVGSATGMSYTLTGIADRINTDVPILRSKHQTDTQPVTDFIARTGRSLAYQYQIQRTRENTPPEELAVAISRVHNQTDREHFATVTLGKLEPDNQQHIQRLIAEHEITLQKQSQAIQNDFVPIAQRTAEREAQQPANLAAMIARAGSGEALPEKVKQQLQAKFNFNLDAVRIHRDGYADKLAKTINAVAFTTGTSIFFQNGTFDPDSTRGRGLLVHELTHVGQQLEGRAKVGIDADSGLEDEAVSAQAKAQNGENTTSELLKREVKTSQIPVSPKPKIQAKREQTNVQTDKEEIKRYPEIEFPIPTNQSPQGLMLAFLQELNPALSIDQCVRFVAYYFQNRPDMLIAAGNFFTITPEEEKIGLVYCVDKDGSWLEIHKMTSEDFEKRLNDDWKFTGDMAGLIDELSPVDYTKVITLAKDIYNASWFGISNNILEQIRNLTPREIEYLHKFYQKEYKQSISERFADYSGSEIDELNIRLSINSQQSKKNLDLLAAQAAVYACKNAIGIFTTGIEEIRIIVNNLTKTQRQEFKRIVRDIPLYASMWEKVKNKAAGIVIFEDTKRDYFNSLLDGDANGMINAALRDNKYPTISTSNITNLNINRALTDQDSVIEEFRRQSKSDKPLNLSDSTIKILQAEVQSGRITGFEKEIIDAYTKGDKETAAALYIINQINNKTYFSSKNLAKVIREQLKEADEPSNIVKKVNESSKGAFTYTDLINKGNFSQPLNKVLLELGKPKQEQNPNILLAGASEMRDVSIIEELFKGKTKEQIEVIKTNFAADKDSNPDGKTLDTFLFEQRVVQIPEQYTESYQPSERVYEPNFIGSEALKIKIAMLGTDDTVENKIAKAELNYQYTRGAQNTFANLGMDAAEFLHLNNSASDVEDSYKQFKNLFDDYGTANCKPKLGVSKDQIKQAESDLTGSTNSYNNQAKYLQDTGIAVFKAVVTAAWVVITRTPPPAWLSLLLELGATTIKWSANTDYRNREALLDLIQTLIEHKIDILGDSKWLKNFLRSTRKSFPERYQDVLIILRKKGLITKNIEAEILKTTGKGVTKGINDGLKNRQKSGADIIIDAVDSTAKDTATSAAQTLVGTAIKKGFTTKETVRIGSFLGGTAPKTVIKNMEAAEVIRHFSDGIISIAIKARENDKDFNLKSELSSLIFRFLEKRAHKALIRDPKVVGSKNAEVPKIEDVPQKKAITLTRENKQEAKDLAATIVDKDLSVDKVKDIINQFCDSKGVTSPAEKDIINLLPDLKNIESAPQSRPKRERKPKGKKVKPNPESMIQVIPEQPKSEPKSEDGQKIEPTGDSKSGKTSEPELLSEQKAQSPDGSKPKIRSKRKPK